MNKLDYYDVGTVDAPVISSSGIGYINPEEGGSPKAFLGFFRDKIETEEKKAFKHGKLVHLFCEHPGEYLVSDLPEPTEMMYKLVFMFSNLILNYRLGSVPPEFGSISTDITSNAKSEKGRESQILETKTAFQDLATILELDSDTCIRLFRYSRIKNNSYSSYNEATIINMILNDNNQAIIKYVKFLLQTRDKITLTVKDKEKIDASVNSMYTNPNVAQLLRLNNHTSLDFEDDKNIVIRREQEVYWQENTKIMGDELLTLKVNCKAKLDYLEINHKRKTITYVDIKSTGYSLYEYQKSFELYRTYRQIAIYKRAILNWFKITYPELNIAEYKLSCYITPVESFGYFTSGVYSVSDLWIFKGMNEFKALLSRYAFHHHTGNFDYSYEEIKGNGILTFKNPPIE